jgi:hypothetical protein
MNRNSKNRRKGQYSQGNKIYLTAYQRSTKRNVKLPLDYNLSELSLDSDADQLCMVSEDIIAIYDTQRVVFVQLYHDIFEQRVDRLHTKIIFFDDILNHDLPKG